MDCRVCWRNARAAVIELDDGGLFETFFSWKIYVNGERRGTTKKVEIYVDGLQPGRRNVVRFVSGSEIHEVGVTTPEESATIDVRDCSARGDGEHDDTANIQVAIMACPEQGRVLVPAGRYLVKSLFLKSSISIELMEGAKILARYDRDALAYIPGTLTGTPGMGHGGPISSRSVAGKGRASAPTAPSLPALVSMMCASMAEARSMGRPTSLMTTGGTTSRTSIVRTSNETLPVRA